MSNPFALVAIGCGAFLLTRRRRRRRRGAYELEPPPPPPLSIVAPEDDPDVALEIETEVAATRQERIEDLLKEFVTDDPAAGKFYQVQFGDTPEDVARAVLSAFGEPTQAQILDYIHCVSGGTYNLDLFGTPSTSNTFPPAYLVPGLGRGLRAAFLPRNDDALALMLSGLAPRMRVHPVTGAPAANATSYGLLWLPPVDPDAFAELGEVTCWGISWDDGSSTLDPPPELFELLEEAA